MPGPGLKPVITAQAEAGGPGVRGQPGNSQTPSPKREKKEEEEGVEKRRGRGGGTQHPFNQLTLGTWSYAQCPSFKT